MLKILCVIIVPINFLSTRNYTVVNLNTLIARDLKHIWHPCAQMKDFETCPPLVIHHAQGSHLYTDQGCLIDALSSWWCKPLGHRHPAIISALEKQLSRFEHVIAANTTHAPLVELGERLAAISRKQHVFFASDGASAVEIALKLSLHAQQVKGQPQRSQFVSLRNSYHGETFATLSVSDIGLYKKPYEGYGLPCHFIDVPYASSFEVPSPTSHWDSVVRVLTPLKDELCAIIVEPLIQGAGGMRVYSGDFLQHLSAWAKAHGIYLIADEIMTGLGRTGTWLATDHVSMETDLICLSKGLSAGALALSCVLIDHDLFDLFYHDALEGPSFLHSHTHSANALAVSAALATLQVMEEENINQQAQNLGVHLLQHMHEVAKISGRLSNIRAIGAIVAADLQPSGTPRIGFRLYQEALKQGALLRPMGNTLYWLPPLNMEPKLVAQLAEITLNSINACY